MSMSSRRRNSLAGVFAATILTLGAGAAGAAEEAVVIPPPAIDETAGSGTETVIFAGGCFWGVQGVFQHVNGVENAVSGYAGGEAETAQYETVSTGSTGHAEAVEVRFDPKKVTYGRLLQIFFSVAHNPTQLNFQGPDRGTQYRSALFVTAAEQREVAERYIDQLDKAHVFPKPIVTKVSDARGFYPAEAYHQDFLTRNPTYPYIVYNDLPKIENLKSLFPADYRSQPMLVGKTKG
jgi:peptide-methionine (S)-S-oxide reductase